MRILSQAEIDNLLSSMLANPAILPGKDAAPEAKPAESDANKPKTPAAV
ncbi:MAG: hypothetical protein LBN40_04920 [Oscillospiraceae bacterium]|jgi:flagellar motor switch protein FliM|nr:hypothetical protein [Oscillospiraceae bacterium]